MCIITDREYITPNFDYQKYQKELDILINKKIKTNEKVAAIANFMIENFPKIPYFWGGGHKKTSEEIIGIDKNWGKEKRMDLKDSMHFKYGFYYPYGLDCSGFCSWCLINAGVDLSLYQKKIEDYALDSQELKKMGKLYNITDKNILKITKEGDMAWTEGHIGIVTEINEYEKTITIVHVSHSGMGTNLTKISTVTGKIIYDDLGNMTFPNNKQNNNKIESNKKEDNNIYKTTKKIKESLNSDKLQKNIQEQPINRLGIKYFTHIVSITYK